MVFNTGDIIQSETSAATTTVGYGTSYDLIIIGGGPAGMTAAIYGGRSGLKVLLLEQALLGGSVNSINLVENYPGFPSPVKGPELMELLSRQVKNLGVEILFAPVTRVALTGAKKAVFIQDGRMFTGRALILATGTVYKKLNVPGEENFLGRGISYCAICDAPFFRGKKVAVVGGGDSAVEEALYLSEFAASVVIIHRRRELRASKIIQKEAFEKENIHFLWDSEIRGFLGDKHLSELVIFNSNDQTTHNVPFDGCFIYVGTMPAVNYAPEGLDTGPDGFIVTDENMKTSVEGVFAAGNVREKHLRQIVTAVSDGAVAAMSAYGYLKVAG